MKFKIATKKSLVLVIFFAIFLSVVTFVFKSSNAYSGNTFNTKNELVENIGSGLPAVEVGKEPELIKAYGIDGTIGYVFSTDLMGVQPKNPKEALELQSKGKNGREIPLYDASGKKVIGKFKINP